MSEGRNSRHTANDQEEGGQEESQSTTLILGAGFSWCAGLPTQKDFSSLLLTGEYESNIDRVITEIIKTFLVDVFGWREGVDLPALEDIFTCIDLSAGTGHYLGIKYPPAKLRALRRMAIYRIFSVLDRRFRLSDDINKLLNTYCKSDDDRTHCDFIVLNWDIVLEKHLKELNPPIAIDYCCHCYDWNTPDAFAPNRGTHLCKMHGSSNWVYCDNCKSLFFDLDMKLPLHTKVGLLKSDFRLFDEGLTDAEFDSALGVTAPDRKCRFCRNEVSSHIATFSYRKSFRTHAYSSIWYQAEKSLADSNHWIFVGYSLPEADYELKHLLKVAQLRAPHRRPLTRKQIEVVTGGSDSTRQKFERFFGLGKIEFHERGLAEYVKTL